jgi:hypothetical protein
MAAMALGEGPKTLSLAPMRARRGIPVRRMMVSGPTKGTVEGSESMRGVKLVMVPNYFLNMGI